MITIIIIIVIITFTGEAGDARVHCRGPAAEGRRKRAFAVLILQYSYYSTSVSIITIKHIV